MARSCGQRSHLIGYYGLLQDIAGKFLPFEIGATSRDRVYRLLSAFIAFCRILGIFYFFAAVFGRWVRGAEFMRLQYPIVQAPPISSGRPDIEAAWTLAHPGPASPAFAYFSAILTYSRLFTLILAKRGVKNLFGQTLDGRAPALLPIPT
jgi:hypothetical protein